MNELAEYLLEDQLAFETMLSRSVTERGFDLDAFQCFRARLLRHIDIEESILLTRPAASWWQLRIEHRALEILARASPPSRKLVGQIRQLLLLHMGAEIGPGGALDDCARNMSWSEQRSVAQRAREHPFRPVSAAPPRDAVRTAAAALRAAEESMCLPAVMPTKISAR